MSEKLLFRFKFVSEQLGKNKENMLDVGLSQNLRKPPLPQLIVVAKVQ